MVESGLYTPRGFISRTEIMKKYAQQPEIQIERPDILEQPSFERELDRIEQLQDLQKEVGLWKDEVEISVDTNGFPFFVFRPLADMHMGAIGTDIKEVREHLHDLKGYSIYTALLGDIGDFFSPTAHPDAMLGDVITPDEQLLTVRRFYENYAEKILCTVQDSSHTDWVRQKAGIEPVRFMVEDLKIPALKNGGMLHLKVNDISYEILLFHQIGKYNSSLNITNAGKRMMDMMQDCDLVVSAHTHIGDVEKLVKRNKKAVILQLGTFKTDDDFGNRKGLSPRPQVFFPTLLFDGRKRNIEMIEDRASATEYLQTFSELLGMKNA